MAGCLAIGLDASLAPMSATWRGHDKVANDKRARKPDWNKRNYIVGVVVAVLTALGLVVTVGHHDSGGITQNFRDGIGIVEGGIHNTQQTFNNYFKPTPTEEIAITPAPSPPTSVMWPAPPSPRTSDTKSVSNDDLYRHKATPSSVDSFANRQDQDDYGLGLLHLAHTHQHLGAFTIYQVIAEGRAVRQQTEAAQEAKRRHEVRLARLAAAKLAEEAARQQDEQNAANAKRQEETRREAQIAATANVPVSAPTPWQWPQTPNTPSSVPAQESEAASDHANDMREVESKNGRPCKTTTDDSSTGHMEMWFYSCVGGNGYGSETYTFLNGKLIDHTRT
jgi:hypothetical protein